MRSRTPVRCSSISEQAGVGIEPTISGFCCASKYLAIAFAPHGANCGMLTHSITDPLPAEPGDYTYHERRRIKYSKPTPALVVAQLPAADISLSCCLLFRYWSAKELSTSSWSVASISRRNRAAAEDGARLVQFVSREIGGRTNLCRTRSKRR